MAGGYIDDVAGIVVAGGRELDGKTWEEFPGEQHSK